MRTRLAALAAITLAAAAACGSSAPPTAASLAQRIHGCTGVTVNTPAVIVQQDVTCLMPDDEQFEIATFANSADETTWISDGGTPDYPAPGAFGCCVEGNGWAADVAESGVNDIYDLGPVLKALGGREVSG
jgi:hypothetical protein